MNNNSCSLQALYFTNQVDLLPSPNIASSDLKLLELDDDLLKEIENRNILSFKGTLNSKLVLCSRNKTYEIKNAEQSNSLIVIPDLLLAQKTCTSPGGLKSPISGEINKSLNKSLEDDDEVSTPSQDIQVPEIQHKSIMKVFYNYLEAREVQPNVKKIQELLSLSHYNGPENEHSIDKRHLLTRRQIFEMSQCSAVQFDEQLRKIRCIKIDGHLRLLDYTYEFRIINLMTNLVNENSWSLENIDKDITISALEEIIPKEIVEAVFDYYTVEIPVTGKYSYNESMLCKIIALNVLQEGLKFHIDEFLDTCQSALPEGIQMDESYLNGIAIVDRDSQIPSVTGLFEENLPMNLLERLRMLFKAKKRWTLQQIAPYVEHFTTPKMQVSSLLTKYTRSLTEDGARYYVSRH